MAQDNAVTRKNLDFVASYPLYLDSLGFVRLHAAMRRAGWPPSPALRRCRPLPVRSQPWGSQGSSPLSRTTEQSLDLQSYGQGRLP